MSVGENHPVPVRSLWVAIFASLVFLPALHGAPPEFVTQWGSPGLADGQFLLPVAVACDSRGYVYVGDAGTSRIQKFDPTGTYVTAWGSRGEGVGQFGRVLGVTVDAADNVYVVDALNGKIQVFDSSGNFLRQWGSASDTPVDGEFYWASNVAIAADGRAYVTDQGTLSGLYGHNVQLFDAAGNFLLRWGVSGSGVGELLHPFGIALDDLGDVYVADSLNDRIQKFDSLGNPVALWGTTGSAPGQLSRPLGLAFDKASGRLYVADAFNDRIQVFDRSGTYLESFGFRGTGPGQMSLPLAVAVDGQGNVFVADSANYRIQLYGPPAVQVPVDVKPGGNNQVNLRSNGLLTVAILTTEDFDAGDVDPLSLELGPGKARIFHASGHFEDVDGDGDLDLLLHFRIQETGIACGDVSVSITGTTFDGERITGTDSIVTTGC